MRINGKTPGFDQDNKPDYLGFHLNEDFETWYNCQKQKIIFDNIRDISIATDGIFMFSPVKKADTGDTINPVEFLSVYKSNAEDEKMPSLK